MRALKFTGTTKENRSAQYISFKAPRKDKEQVTVSLFPPYQASVAAHSFSEYASGQNKDPILS